MGVVPEAHALQARVVSRQAVRIYVRACPVRNRLERGVCVRARGSTSVVAKDHLSDSFLFCCRSRSGGYDFDVAKRGMGL